MVDFATLLRDHEDWLIDRIILYAGRQGYTAYTSTLREAWHISIHELTEVIVRASANPDAVELRPEHNYTEDPLSAFGRLEARRHRERGVDLSMFLGLTKYYRQAYVDLIDEKLPDAVTARGRRTLVERVFDRVELGFVLEWLTTDEQVFVSELQATNRRMTNEKNRYLTVFESAASPILLLDVDHQIENLNHVAARLFLGDDTPGSRYYAEGDRLPPFEWLEPAFEAFEKAPERRFECDVEVRTTEGLRSFVLRLSPMLDVSAKFSGSVALLEDVTTIRTLEMARERAIHELERSNRELEQFAQVVSHDLRDPLRSVSGYLALLDEEEQALSQEGRDFVRYALGAATRMRTLIETLLEYARVGKGDTTLEPVPVSELMEVALKALDARIRETAAFVSYEGDLPIVFGNRALLAQLLQNLIANALKFAGDRPPAVHVSAAPIGGEGTWEIRVADKGIGIDPQDHERVFLPFERLHGRGVFEGTGLGLATCQRIVQIHGGRIRVESTLGAGATFVFTLRAGEA